MSKKIIVFLLTVIIGTMGIAGCTAADSTVDQPVTGSSVNTGSETGSMQVGAGVAAEIAGAVEEQQEEGVKVDEGLFLVDITVPSSWFEEEGQRTPDEEIKEAAKESGYKDCKINEDGSVTYTMTKAKRDEILQEYKANVDETISGMLEGEDAVESFKSIEYNNDMTRFDIKVDPEKYSDWDSLSILAFYFAGAYYQIFDGVDGDRIDVKVYFINDNTGDVIDQGSYKDWINNMSEDQS